MTAQRGRRRALADTFEQVGAFDLLDLLDAGRRKDSVTIVNYHATPAHLADSLARQFDRYRDHYECLDEDGLLAFLDGSRRLSRPGIAITFDDGYASNATVAAPLLAARGLVGFFFVPGGFLDADEPAQAEFSRTRIREAPNAEHPDLAALRAMTWDQARALAAGGHAVGCHTWTHESLGPDPSDDTVEREVVQAKAKLEERLQRPVRSFCWVRGRLQDYSRRADLAIRAHYALAFLTFGKRIAAHDDPLRLWRFNVEASFSAPLAKLQASPFTALWNARRRRTLRRLLAS